MMVEYSKIIFKLSTKLVFNLKLNLGLIVAVSFLYQSLLAQEMNFSPDKNLYNIKRGKTTYMVQRNQEHQPYIQTIILNYKCSGHSKWRRHFYKHGYCAIKSAQFNPKDGRLFLKYFMLDLDSGSDYKCKTKAEFLSIDLKDICSVK